VRSNAPAILGPLRKRWLIAGAVVLVLVALAAGILVAYRMHQERNIKGSPTVEFTTTAPPKKPVPPPKPQGIVWPLWGYDPPHTRAPEGIRLLPPYRAIWTFNARQLLEFPPAIAYGRLYINSYDGIFYALNEKTGKLLWHFSSGRCAASSAAVGNGVVYATFIGRPPCNDLKPDDGGLVAAFNARTGKLLWRFSDGPDETSPLLANGLVYVGNWDGDVSALDQRTGHLRWRFKTGGPVKGSVALSGSNVIVGSYDGHVYALDAKRGSQVWRGSAQPRFSLSLGTFYSTPAVAYGRVYIGNTDGKIYSYGAKTGELRWSHSTGGYVYSSPAVWDERVYAGSYDGTFYALDAATGDTVWTFKAAGPISGAPTVINGVVYFACFKSRTYALNAATGKLIWSFGAGHYTPVVADAKRLYLVGYGRLYGMIEKAKKAAARRKR
jgi:outer membrane protein assembly factor BamB